MTFDDTELQRVRLRTIDKAQEFFNTREKSFGARPALLGKTNDPGDASVPNSPGFVYARVGSEKAVKIVFNDKVLPKNGMPVWVGRLPYQPTLVQVLSVRQVHGDESSSGSPVGGGSIAAHAHEHVMYNPQGSSDVVPIRVRQLEDGKVFITTPVSMAVNINDVYIEFPGYPVQYYAGVTSLSLSSYLPSLLNFKWIRLYIDASAALQIEEGLESSTYDISEIPSVPTAPNWTLAAVLLTKSMTAITEWPDPQSIQDLRFPTMPTNYVRWAGKWDEDDTYLPNDMATEEGWLGIANKRTTDPVAPQPLGQPDYILPDSPSWATPAVTESLTTGIDIDVTSGLWLVSAIRFWVHSISSSVYYRVVIEDLITGATQLGQEVTGDTFGSTGWKDFSVSGDTFLTDGDHIRFLLQTRDTSSDTTFNGDWTHSADNSDYVPLAGESHRRLNRDWIRFNYEEDDTDDRTTDLQSVIPGTVITNTGGAEYEVIEWIDGTTYIEYMVNVVTESATGLDTWTFTVPVPASLTYVRLVDYWLTQPDGADVQGVYAEGSDTPTLNDNAYGIDIEAAEYSVSLDWDLISSA